MSAISRRDFCKSAGMQAAAAGFLLSGALELRANPLGMPIGCQTWPVRDMIAKDFPGTIKQLAAAGFQTIELCSPVGYADSGFAGLAKYSGTELRKILSDAGVTCESSHFCIQELRDNQADRIGWAKDLGLKQMIVPSLDGPKRPTMDDVKRAAAEYNKMGEQVAKAGIQQGLHNEDFELSMVDGKRTYDLLLDLLDPKLVRYQFQMSTITAGFVAADYFTKYPGRFFSMHLQDINMKAPAPATEGTSPRHRYPQVAMGRGSIDWVKTFTAAKIGGVKNYFVEQNWELTQQSVAFLKTLNV